MADDSSSPSSKALTLFISQTFPHIDNLEAKLDTFISTIDDVIKIFNEFLFPVYNSQPDQLTITIVKDVLKQNDPFRDGVVTSGLSLSAETQVHLRNLLDACDKLYGTEEADRLRMSDKMWESLHREALILQSKLKNVYQSLHDIIKALEGISKRDYRQHSRISRWPPINPIVVAIGLIGVGLAFVLCWEYLNCHRDPYGYIEFSPTNDNVFLFYISTEDREKLTVHDAILSPLISKLNDIQNVISDLLRFAKSHAVMISYLKKRIPLGEDINRSPMGKTVFPSNDDFASLRGVLKKRLDMAERFSIDANIL
ncbi:hypothetical protein BC936DRAFT_142102 [Jimgerdemannia flammicorona]|uniref:Uncharacterized protein n=1 Tax=Jimgerdemannia flammicorona TaxID=994334 RepID=A0A433DMM5_9FUNG|nr:hypothetical protein BC936DRAFT_142102 [Jimgerdemannia flammicorona]